jgi:hypothetical protein
VFLVSCSWFLVSFCRCLVLATGHITHVTISNPQVINEKGGKMFRATIITFYFISHLAHAKHIRLNIQDAVNLKLIKTSVSSLGGYQGFCIKISVNNLTKDSLIINLEAGRRLNSLDDKYQDILIVKEEDIFLRGSESKSQNIKGYCCQANHSSPGLGARYCINKKAEPRLFLLANYLNKNHYDAGTEQQAIWAVSDNRSTAHISASNDTLVKPLRHFVAGLKGEPIPWYTIISSSFTYPGGSIMTVPKFLRGELEYSINTPVYSTCYVLDEHSIPVCIIIGSWLLPGLDKKYPLNIPVKGLAKGKYTIELTGESGIITKKEFQI